jgi:prepilin-type N-terminal cleavage/methylation domain-containing protein
MFASPKYCSAQRCGFTFVELLIVLIVLSILGGLISVGLGGVLNRARVQRSVYSFVQTTTLAKQLAIANRRVYTVTFNSAKPPGNTANTVPMSFTTDARNYSGVGSYFGSPGNAQMHHSITAPAPLWSDRPEDQWYALMGPYQDADGRWWQCRGGMPTRDMVTKKRRGQNEVNSDVGRASDYGGQLGGCFGPPSIDPQAVLPGNTNSWDNWRYEVVRIAEPADWPTAWRWDPYESQVGPRRFLERGTRWVAMFDCPEWAAMGSSAGDPTTSNQRNYGNLTACFQWATAAHLTTGRSNAKNEWAVTTSFNFYPSGEIDRNQCGNAEAYSFSGQNFDQRAMGYVGICTNRTKPASFQAYNGNTGADDTSKSLLTYNRPVAMTWITLFSSGQVITGNAPRQIP